MHKNTTWVQISAKYNAEKGIGNWSAQINSYVDASTPPKKHLTGSLQSSTPREIELISAISVLSLLPEGNEVVEVIIDSAYILGGLEKMIHQRNQGELPLETEDQARFKDLWNTLYYLNSRRNISWKLPNPKGLTAISPEKTTITPSKDTTFVVYTDGSCLGNPGRGGWGAVVEIWVQDQIKDSNELSGFEEKTTNNRMELTGAIKVLEAIPDNSEVTIFSDSKYLIDGITNWIKNWKAHSWRTASKKPVKNKDLWIRLDEVASNHRIKWEWVKGHHISEGNNRADELATSAAEGDLVT